MLQKMLAQKSSSLQRIIVLGIVISLVSIALVLISTNSTYAMTGDATAQIPNNGSVTPWLILTRPGSNGMDAPLSTNIAYIPVSVGLTFSMTITDACDGTVNDASGSSNDSVFFLDGAEVSNVTTSSSGSVALLFLGEWLVRCDTGTNSVISVTMKSTAPTVTIGGVQYRFLVLTASTSNSASLNYYANRFRYNAAGASGIKFAYATSLSQPTGAGGYTGIAYSNSSSSGWGWSTSISFALPCDAAPITARRVWFFDTDHTSAASSSSPYWQSSTQPMRYSIKRYNRQTGALLQTIYTNEWLVGGQDVHEGTKSFTIDSDFKYTIEMTNINFVNSLQVALPVNSVFATDPCTNNPVGFIDSCTLSGNTTTLYGWAYDSNATTSAQPSVTVNATGQVAKVVTTPYSYRSTQINDYLTTNNYLGNRGNLYGFRVTYTGLVRTSTYTISGTVANVGSGANTALTVNPFSFPPAGGIAGSLGFPSNRIPTNCIPPAVVVVTPPSAPTCTATGGAFDLGVAGIFTNATATHTNPNPMTISSATYEIKNSGGAIVASGSDITDLDIAGIDSTDYDGQEHTINTSGTYNVLWTFRWSYGGSAPANITCPTIVTINLQALECSADSFVETQAGLAFPNPSTVRVRNNNPVVVRVTDADYVIAGANLDGSDRIGEDTNVGNIAANDEREFSFSDNIIRPSKIRDGGGGSYTVTWTIKTDAGDEIDCPATIMVEVIPPACTTNPVSAGVGESFNPEVNVENPNAAVNVKMNSMTYVINPGNYTGSVAAVDRTDAPPGNKTYGGSPITITAAGQYSTLWTIQWQVAPFIETITCPPLPNDTTISRQPYVRFYGNDVFAGGGFGDSCSATGTIDARAYGRNTTHNTYLGSASELAVFAVGVIQEILPGSQRNRAAAQELAFANTTATVANGIFGGGFGSVVCGNDYYAQSIGATQLNGTNINLSNLASGSYSYGNGGGTTDFTTGNGISDARNLVIYVNGNARITSNNANRFGYANAVGSWNSFSEIPTLYIIASGNIYIDSNVSVMDGVYIAQPRTNSTTSGQIYTCSNGAIDPLGNLSDTSGSGNAAFLLSNCNNQLTVNGAFIGKRINLLRSFGTVSEGKTYETYLDGTNRMAEIFKFSPELYFVEGGGLPPRSTNAKIDSIVSLPPAF